MIKKVVGAAMGTAVGGGAARQRWSRLNRRRWARSEGWRRREGGGTGEAVEDGDEAENMVETMAKS
jgi:hypothetical protein